MTTEHLKQVIPSGSEYDDMWFVQKVSGLEL